MGLPIDCEGPHDTTNNLPLVELRSFLQEPEKTCAMSNSLGSVTTIVANQDTICFELADFVSATPWLLQVDGVTSIFTDAGGTVTTVASEQLIAQFSSAPVKTDSNAQIPGFYAPANGEQGGTYSVIVDFSQPVSGRRLRAEYEFGVGTGHKESSVRVLPAEVQVQEQLEALEDSEDSEADGTSGSTTIENTTIYVGIALIVTG